MNKAGKTFMTVVVIFLYFILSAIIMGIREDAGYSTPGMLAFILFIAMIGAIKAIWKKDKTDHDSDNSSLLQK